MVRLEVVEVGDENAAVGADKDTASCAVVGAYSVFTARIPKVMRQIVS